MEEMIYSDSFQKDIALTENASELVQKINEIIPIVAYITARPSSVVKGTKHWHDKHKFPKAPVITRPDNVTFDDRSKWKARVLEDMYPEVMGIVDDHRKLADNLSKNYGGILFLYNTTENKRSDINIIPCKTWEDVYVAVRSITATYPKNKKVRIQQQLTSI